MDLTSEFLKSVLDLRRETTVEIGGLTYFTRPEGGASLAKPPLPSPLKVTTLTGFVGAVIEGIDGSDLRKGQVLVHVEDYKTVKLVEREANEYGDRQTFIAAVYPERAAFPFSNYLDPETFIIKLQQGFEATENVAKLIALVSALSYANSVRTEDDGITQQVTVNKGAVTRGNATVVPMWPLAARRTFSEVTQPVTPFLLRMRGEDGKLPQIALHEIDGGVWQNQAMAAIAEYLEPHLDGHAVLS
jgi:hypothetical protein